MEKITSQHPCSEGVIPSMDTPFLWIMAGQKPWDVYSGQKSLCPQTKHPKIRPGRFYESAPFLEDHSHTRRHLSLNAHIPAWAFFFFFSL